MENTTAPKRVNLIDMVNHFRQDNNFVFYASFYESILTQSPEVQLEIFDALCMYGCRGVMPETLSCAAAGIFMSCMPQIEAAQTRYDKAGKGGGSNNPSGRRGKKTKSDNNELTQELTEKTQLTETRTEKQTEKTETGTEKTNEELNENRHETKNRLNIEYKEENKEEYKEELEIKKEEQLQQQKEIEVEKQKHEVKQIQQQLQQQQNIEPTHTDSYVTDDDVDGVVADARTIFIDDFFTPSRLPVIERQAESLGVTMAEYRRLVEQVLDDWEMSSLIPEPSPDERRHMVYTVRKKHDALQLQAQRRRAAASQSTPSAVAAQTDSTLERGRRAYEERMEAERREREAMYNRPVLRGDALRAKLEGFNWRTGQYDDSPDGTSPAA